MEEIKIKNRLNGKIIISGKYKSIKDCLEKNRGADLRGADLGGAKNYSESHDFLIEIIKRQSIDYFTKKEWSVIGKVLIKRLCWDSIKKEFGKDFLRISKKISKLGFDEYEKRFKEILKG